MNGQEFSALISSIACIISKNKTNDELDILSAFFTQLGDTLDTISTVNGICISDEND